jgi:S-adenosylmethionine synthetase
MTLIVKGTSFNLHKVILYARSEFFRQLLEINPNDRVTTQSRTSAFGNKIQHVFLQENRRKDEEDYYQSNGWTSHEGPRF